MSEIGLAVIGGGAIAERHMQAFEQLGGVRRQWIISDRSAAARDFAGRWKFAQAGTALEESLKDPLVDLVLIASPSPLHAEQAIRALQSGKDVLVEIPVATSWQDAQQVARAATGSGRRVWVCHTMRSRPALQRVRERVQTGQLHLTQIRGFAGIPRRRNQGMDNVGTRSWIDNLLWHHGCHQVDNSLWVLGMPPVLRVQALYGPTHPTLGMRLDVGVQMSVAGGVLINHSLSYNVEQSSWRLQFIGHEDVLTYDDGRLWNEAGEELVAGQPAVNCLAQNREVLHAWRTGEECDYDLKRVLPVMEVLGRAECSADE